jgi:hypothetical protein
VGTLLPQSTVVDCKFSFDLFFNMPSENIEPMTASNVSADGIEVHDPEKLAAVAENADALKLLALGHKEELKRNFSVYSIAAMGFVNGK